MVGWARLAIVVVLATGPGCRCAGSEATGAGSGARAGTGAGTGTGTGTGTNAEAVHAVDASTGADATTGTGMGTDASRSTGDDPSMVTVPAAFFMMGSRFGVGDADERPMHEVAIASFSLDRTEVTTDAYRACVAAGACTPTPPGPFCNEAHAERGNHPINCIDFAQAEAVCAWAGKRLPDEREWEYVASGGVTGPDKPPFPWGEEPPDERRACYHHQGTCPVGSFAPTAFGLLDVSGNVWEWTSSWYGPYPDGALEGRARVYRGGSWSRRFPKWMRITLRNRYHPAERSSSLGVRCARTREPVTCPDGAEARGAGCVRVRGKPACEPAFRWQGGKCVLDVPGTRPPPGAEDEDVAIADHRAPAASTPARGAGVPAASGSTAEPAARQEELAAAPIQQARDPGADSDCEKNFRGAPFAYRITGGTFQTREPVFRASGCQKRDVSRTATSLCCAH